MATKTVTDEDGNEYEVEESALEETFNITNLPKHAESVSEVTHRPLHTGYNYVANIDIDGDGAYHLFEQSDMFGASEMGRWLSEHDVELDIRCVEWVGGGLKVYFYVEE